MKQQNIICLLRTENSLILGKKWKDAATYFTNMQNN